MATTQTKVDPTNDDVRVAYRPVRRGPLQLTGEGFRDMWSRRRLARYLVQAEVTKRGSDTVLGNVWWVLDPLLQMVVYVVLVQFILGINKPDYPLFIFTAILPWKWFSASVGESVTAVISREKIIKQVKFPTIVLPVSAALGGVVNFAFGLVPLGVMLIVLYTDRATPYVLLIPIIAFVQFVFTLAMAIGVSAVNVFYRDVGNVVRHVLRLWFYLSPALYSAEQIRKLSESNPIVGVALLLNPFTTLFESYRAVIYHGTLPPFGALAVLLAVSLILLCGAIFFFKRVEPAFAKVL